METETALQDREIQKQWRAEGVRQTKQRDKQRRRKQREQRAVRAEGRGQRAES